MTDYIKKNYNNVKVTNEDFIKKNYDNNDFSLIFCNPPFTLGTNKTFYIDFLFKCFDILTKSKIKYEKNIFEKLITIKDQKSYPANGRIDLMSIRVTNPNSWIIGPEILYS